VPGNRSRANSTSSDYVLAPLYFLRLTRPGDTVSKIFRRRRIPWNS